MEPKRRSVDALAVLKRATKKIERVHRDVLLALDLKEDLRLRELRGLHEALEDLESTVDASIASIRRGHDLQVNSEGELDSGSEG